MRVKMVCEAATGDPRNPPPSLCNEIRAGGKGRCRRIGRLLPEGGVERFKSLREAGRAVGMSTDWLDHLASTCSVDSGGATWFERPRHTSVDLLVVTVRTLFRLFAH